MAGFGESFGESFGVAGVSYFRHGMRHVQQTVETHVAQCLSITGWTSEVAAERPFGAKQVQMGGRSADEWKAESVQPNYVGVTFGEQPPIEDLELGGGLAEVQTTLTLDVYGENYGVGLAIACDLYDWLAGEVTSEHLLVMDWSLTPPAPRPGHTIELSDVARRRPEADLFRRQWFVVNATIMWRYVRPR